MNVKLIKSVGLALGTALIPALFVPVQAYAKTHSSKPEEIEWAWEVRPKQINPSLPNVLLLGDSITRNYYPEVQRLLSDVANVYLMATSTSVGDPRLPRQLEEFTAMEVVSFKLVHFNNGMHGWTYSEEEYRAGFPTFLAAIHHIAPSASLIWATTTPVKVDDVPGPTNARVDSRNKIAQDFIEKARIPTDDQHDLMLHHRDQYEDKVHFNTAGSAIQGRQVAEQIRSLLAKR